MRAFGYSKRPLATSTFPASEGRSGCTATGALTALRAARHFARLRSGGRLGFGRSSRVRRPHLSQVFGCLQPAAMQCSGAGARHFADSLVCLTIRSSRRRFAARLNSGVRRHTAFRVFHAQARLRTSTLRILLDLHAATSRHITWRATACCSRSICQALIKQSLFCGRRTAAHSRDCRRRLQHLSPGHCPRTSHAYWWTSACPY